ncbi:MAG: MOSC domain-containing protein [Armatimonadetes bacterium]|nr:MOSC domain-containing protein [Armatimonadota bacterium]
MQLLSLHVGRPQQRTSAVRDGQPTRWTSAIYKQPVVGPRALGPTNLDGDAQGDTKNHGGPDKAVCCYPAEHYPSWRELLGLDAASFPYGAFGENFTLVGLTEDQICIGDTFQVGTARVQVSQPRMPCWKLGRKWERPELPGEAVATGRTGYYLRVLQPGLVSPGDPLTLLNRPLPDWPVARVNAIMYVHKDDAALAAEAARLPFLAEAWKSPFRRRVGLIASRAK